MVNEETQQSLFGGLWTQQKLTVLSKYLREYRRIFEKNEKAKFFEISYIDAFAGTGIIPRPQLGRFESLFPDETAKAEREFRKGSVRRALEVNPPFHHYVFIEKNPAKCKELESLKEEFPNRDISINAADANQALLQWCTKLDTRNQRAVVFLDPFGASVEWKVLKALAKTEAVDLWILFPYSAINRMLIKDRKPPKAWADRLTRIFGTADWESRFYASEVYENLIYPDKVVERIHKTADASGVIAFFLERLRTIFAAVSEPGPLYNSREGLLFVFLFAAGNRKGATIGLNIANHLLKGMRL